MTGYGVGTTVILNDGRYPLNSKNFKVFILRPLNFSSTHTLSCGSSSSRREIIPAIRQKMYHDYETYAKTETSIFWMVTSLKEWLFFTIIKVYISKFKN